MFGLKNMKQFLTVILLHFYTIFLLLRVFLYHILFRIIFTVK